MMNNRPGGPYANTPVTRDGYLDILKPIPVPRNENDIRYTITPAYQNRPDLLAHDLYGDRGLWWVFAQRNPDELVDPVFDFVAGVEIHLPQGDSLRTMVGNRS